MISAAQADLNCIDSNTPEYEDTVLETRRQIVSRDPLAFAPKILQRMGESPANNIQNKSVLVGLQGVVKKAVGLGGWQWLGSMNCNPSKEQLLDPVQQHFASQHVDEVQGIVEFIHAAKILKSACGRRRK